MYISIHTHIHFFALIPWINWSLFGLSMAQSLQANCPWVSHTWYMSPKPYFIFLGSLIFFLKVFKTFQGILSLPRIQMGNLQSSEIHSSLPLKARTSWQGTLGSKEGDAGLHRMRSRLREGAILGGRFPLNGCLGLAIFHCNCWSGKLTVSGDESILSLMDQWKLLRDWYDSFSLTFPVQMKALLSIKLCMDVPTRPLIAPKKKPPSMDFTYWKSLMLKALGHLYLLAVIYVFSCMIYIYHR